MVYRGDTPAGAADTGQDEEVELKFRRKWMETLFTQLELNVDEKTRNRLLENCGRECARRSSFHRTAENCAGDLKTFIEKFGAIIGEDNCKIAGDFIDLKYSECYCPLVKKGDVEVPDFFCDCSRGWVMEMFETVLGSAPDVETVTTIIRGGSECHFRIQV
jgi:hypothetical protein